MTMRIYDSLETVEATQVTEEWFTKDHPNALHVPGVWMDPVTKEVWVTDAQGRELDRGGIGSWVVKKEEGKLFIMADKLFKFKYRAAFL